jgi:hypothetical protein
MTTATAAAGCRLGNNGELEKRRERRRLDDDGEETQTKALDEDGNVCGPRRFVNDRNCDADD